MIQKTISVGKIFVTDSDFGHVGVGQADFPERFSKQFGFIPSPVVWMDQVHGRSIQWVQGMREHASLFPKTDGLMTQQRDVMLITKTADCVPILLWNDEKKIIAALHCGWRGFLADIIPAFAERCKERGFDPGEFSAFLGPHLRASSFEVKEDFLRLISPKHAHLVIKRDGKSFFDITSGVQEQLGGFGVSSIEDCGIDTFSDEDYFSFRRWTQSADSVRPKTYNTFANCIIIR